ncbi:hypothetical protein G5714_019933 [Onychostoma macrolepis]|uniref:DOMON domain-containing protein n=1 Tax=Onychostoma macrolepis TaxID=369639 RepID=A0A7J6BXU1_9TELE|nr:hypothetical protein G5714_019933 [Onychostoma macrolepis]
MVTLSLVLLLLSVQWSWAQEDPLLPFSEHLDLEHKVRLKWGFDEIQGSILFELTVNTSGWVSFGFSPKGGMTGADIVIGGVGPKGSYFTDRYAVGKSIPLVDQQQNYKLLSLTESDGKTVMKFQRSIDSCDENDLPITIEPFITNFDLVHHLLLYRCPASVTEAFETECYTGNDGECMQTVAVWGVGGGAFEFPEVAGLPIGGNVGRVDNSGLRFYYTSELRQHDTAVLMTGLAVAPGYAIPPKAKSFLTYGLCDTAYIPTVLETPHDLQVFSVMLHTHLAGRKVRVRHFSTWLNMMFMKTWNETSIHQFQQTLKRIDQHVMVINSNNNISINTGLIPDLNVIPSAPCMSNSATRSLALPSGP